MPVQSLVYVPGSLQILQNLRKEAQIKNNRRLEWAFDVVITELIGCGDKSINTALRYYNKARKATPKGLSQ